VIGNPGVVVFVNTGTEVAFLVLRRTQVFEVDASLFVPEISLNAVLAVTGEEGSGHRIELWCPPLSEDEEECDEERKSQETPDHRASDLPRRHVVAARSR